ncbi:NHL repeat-containing protein [candidate division KSB1 bacterium]
MFKLKSLFLLLAIISFSVSCTKEEGVKVKKEGEIAKKEVITGAKIIHNTAPFWGETPKVKLEFVQKIGVLEGNDENYILYNPCDVIKDGEGNIYVLDSGNNRIQKYDNAGKFVKTIGSKGQGPGEFDRTRDFQLDSSNNIVVGDYGNNRFQIFSLEGEFIKTIRFKERIIEFSLMESGNILSWGNYNAFVWRSGENLKNAHLFAVFNQNGEFIYGFGKVKDYGEFGASFDGNFVRYEIWKDGNIYVLYNRQNKIEKYSPEGTLLFTADRPLNYELKGEMAELPDGQKYLRLPTASFHLGVDYKGRIWINSYSKQPEDQNDSDTPSTQTKTPAIDHYIIEIFDNEGILLGYLPCPVKFIVLRIYESSLFLIDKIEEQCIYEYKIIETQTTEK